MNKKPTAARRFLSLLLSASVVVCSVEPAFSQVRAVAAEASAFRVGQTVVPQAFAIAPGALNASSNLSLGNLASPFAAAPSWSVASLPVSAAVSPVARPVAAAAAPTTKVASGAQPVEGSERASAEPAKESRDTVGSLETLAHPGAAPEAVQAERTGTIFFDQARSQPSSVLTVAGKERAEAARLEPRDSGASTPSGANAEPPPPSKARALARKILWGAGALALPVVTFGWMSFLKSAAPSTALAPSAFTDWSAIARGVAFAGPLVVLGIWEAAKFYRSKKQGALPWLKRLQLAKALHKPFLPRLNHYLTNLAFGAVGIAMIAIFAGPHINDFNHFLDVHNVGLLRWLHVGGWKNVLAGITILDFLGWWWHYAAHRFPLLWRLHKVHHSDIEYNFSTTYRTHWAEMAAEILGRMAMYALVGPTLLTITIYEIIILGLAQYQHANIKMPARLEEALSRLIMTSHKHFIHHSLARDDYDSNYGFIFAFWDKMFGTFKNYAPEHLSNKITTGIRDYPRAQDLTFFKLLWMPFRSQKPAPKKS